MDILETVRRWVMTFPGWEQLPLPRIDGLGAVPGDGGLFPKGLEQLGRMEDVLGNVKRFCRYTVTLQMVRHAPDGADAAALLEFQNWVADQSEAGLAPTLGEDTRWRAESGRLEGNKGVGTGVYTVNLMAEFTEIYQ